mgnify:CR=1 FL=1
MPLPTPNPDEKKDNFVDRCMGNDTMNDEFPDRSQRRAVCERKWDEDKAQAMGVHYPGIVNAVFNQPWALLPETYGVICELVRSRSLGIRLTAEQIQERIATTDNTAIAARHVGAGAARNWAVAIIPVYGVLAQRMNMMTQVSGGTSTELLGKMFREAIREPSITAIILDVDSPGGSVFGVDELASEIYANRNVKPILAVANSLAASAAYWIASQADEFVITPGGLVGSIGVLTAHEDISKAQEIAGVKTTVVSAGKFKAEGEPFQPLSETAREALQSMVDDYYGVFLQVVARGRKRSLASVKSGFGQGRLVNAEDAKAEGMVDSIATLDQTIARLMGHGSHGQVGAVSDADMRQRRLRIGSL